MARRATSCRPAHWRVRWCCNGACLTRSGTSTIPKRPKAITGNTAGFSVSANTKETVEQEVQKFIQDGYDWALKIITESDEQEFERLAQGLLEYETLTGEEIERVMRGEPPHAPDDEDGGSKVEEDKPSLTAIPKAKKKSGPSGDGGMEPEPSA